jgi:hypothetical protein
MSAFNVTDTLYQPEARDVKAWWLKSLSIERVFVSSKAFVSLEPVASSDTNLTVAVSLVTTSPCKHLPEDLSMGLIQFQRTSTRLGPEVVSSGFGTTQMRSDPVGLVAQPE